MNQDSQLPTNSLQDAPPHPISTTQNNPGINQGQKTDNDIPMQSGGMENYLTKSQVIEKGSKSVTGKLIATLFSLIILTGGVLAGVFLVEQQQEIRSSASEQECLQSPNCLTINNPEESGSYKINGIIYDVYLTDENANIFGASLTEDGCYQTKIEGDTLSWERTGKSSECNNLINIQIWMIEIPQELSDPIISQCRNILIYDKDWKLLSTEEITKLAEDEEIKISVDSSTTAGSIDQVRFTINSTVLEPTNLKKPGTNEIYVDYVIPGGVNELEINAQLYHSTFGWF